MLLDWIWMTLNTSMRDLTFLQWLLVVGIMVGMILGGLYLRSFLYTLGRALWKRQQETETRKGRWWEDDEW